MVGLPGAVIFLVALLGAVLLLPAEAVAQPSMLTLKVDPPVVTEGAGFVTVTWQLNVEADRTYGMRFGSGVGSATQGEDYTIIGTCSGNVYFGDFGDGVDPELVEGLKKNCVRMPKGSKSVTTQIFIADDQEAEGDEEVIIPVTIPALVIGERITFTIRDNDGGSSSEGNDGAPSPPTPTPTATSTPNTPPSTPTPTPTKTPTPNNPPPGGSGGAPPPAGGSSTGGSGSGGSATTSLSTSTPTPTATRTPTL